MTPQKQTLSEALDDPWFSTQSFDRIPQFMPEMGDAETTDMPQFDPLHMAPQSLAGSQLRGIGWEPFEVEVVSGPRARNTLMR